MFDNDNRTVLTLDAGGTNFVFSAIRGNQEIISPICLPAYTNDLDKCLETIILGFSSIKNKLSDVPVAISFAFPGPADYKNGIIGDLPNFPCFRGGIALGPYLEKYFKIPVFINNDGNLFAYGEALAGLLPHINKTLELKGSKKQYHNLIGLTFGTGFGCGIVLNNTLLTGDNDCGGDVWSFRNKLYPEKIAEESVSIRAILRVYKELSGENNRILTPKDIYDIADGSLHGDKQAAIASFAQLGEVAGDCISHLLSFTDGLVVIGGGISAASKYIFPSLIKEVRSQLRTFSGESFSRLQMDVFDLTNNDDLHKFTTNTSTSTVIPYTNEQVRYESRKRNGISISTLGTNKAIALGAYAYALSNLYSQHPK